ncbi:MAG: AMP-binding protein [Filifactor alocis]|nr:AMP-binding protein [Filifactor alocis]
MKFNYIDEILQKNKERFKDHDYIFEKKDGEFRAHTYGEFYTAVRRGASFLRERGLKGKKIALYLDDSYDYMVADIAVTAYVGTGVCLSSQWKTGDLENIIDEVDLDAVLYEASKSAVVDELKKSRPCVDYIPIEEMKTSEPVAELEDWKVDETFCSKIVFSSGTTGSPKAVMLSQKNMFANMENLLRRAPMNDSDICYLFLPLNHTYGGICNFLYSVSTGMRIYLCSDKNLIMQEVAEVRPTVFCAVPILFEKIYAYAKANGAEVSKLLGGRIKYLFSGGAYLQSEIRKAFKEEKLNLLEAYGLSETTSLVSLEYSNSDDFESVGTVFENIEVRIDSPDENGVGEITVRGDNIFIGYYNREELYLSSFDEDGYFRTGDLGCLRGDKLYLTGRKKRVIIRANARNIYPEEIEAIIEENLKVEAVKIFDKNGRLHCTVFSDVLTDAQELMEEINALLPKYCRIEGCDILKSNLNTKLK